MNTSSRQIATVSLFAALIAVFGLIPKIDLPLGVPITLQTLGVMLAGALLRPRLALLAVALFLAAVILQPKPVPLERQSDDEGRQREARVEALWGVRGAVHGHVGVRAQHAAHTPSPTKPDEDARAGRWCSAPSATAWPTRTSTAAMPA